ncbi:hypothetical protein MTP99_011765 [Tenebrio molitor]|jgi:hypothetical protein|nr:hypothetical protein MTP99_011765 [Tenebrio molitor]
MNLREDDSFHLRTSSLIREQFELTLPQVDIGPMKSVNGRYVQLASIAYRSEFAVVVGDPFRRKPPPRVAWTK